MAAHQRLACSNDRCVKCSLAGSQASNCSQYAYYYACIYVNLSCDDTKQLPTPNNTNGRHAIFIFVSLIDAVNVSAGAGATFHVRVNPRPPLHPSLAITLVYCDGLQPAVRMPQPHKQYS